MTAPSDPRLLVLHGLRLKGIAEAEGLASLARLDEAEVEVQLASLVADGLAARRDGRLSGWTATTEGRDEHRRLIAAEVDALGAREELGQAYERFLVLNPELLQVCTRWQLRDLDGASTVNDHRDQAYDAAVLDELASLHERVGPVLSDLETILARFARYAPSLGAALDAVRAGDLDMFTKPVVPSYHTLWFELHEDLLATLSLERSSETQQSRGSMSA